MSSSPPFEDENDFSDEEQIDDQPADVASNVAVEPATEIHSPEAKGDTTAASEESEDQSHGIRVEKDVFYNDETIKYMRIIDTYKKLGVGKDIELPRVCDFLQMLPGVLLTPWSSLSLGLKIAASRVCLKI
jgi:hypothetical protein